jgi:predicted SprT family Zn-dependent metalloprotease
MQRHGVQIPPKLPLEAKRALLAEASQKFGRLAIEILNGFIPVARLQQETEKPEPPKQNVAYETTGITGTQYLTFQRAFYYFNTELFGGTLVDLMINLNRKAGYHGYYSKARLKGRGSNATIDEIGLNPDTFTGRTDEDILSTLAHEMVHHWQAYEGTPPRAAYHDREFAAKMKSIGLCPSSTGQPGGRETGQRMTHYIVAGGPYATAYAKLANDGLRLDWESLPPDPKKRESKTKVTCGRCGLNMWGKPGSRIRCDECLLKEAPPEIRAWLEAHTGSLMLPANQAPEEVHAAYVTNAA